MSLRVRMGVAAGLAVAIAVIAVAASDWSAGSRHRPRSVAFGALLSFARSRVAAARAPAATSRSSM